MSELGETVLRDFDGAARGSAHLRAQVEDIWATVMPALWATTTSSRCLENAVQCGNETNSRFSALSTASLQLLAPENIPGTGFRKLLC